MLGNIFGSLFSSKNRKLVIKWRKEHEEIVVIAHKVIASYSKNDLESAKKELIFLNGLAVDHLMDEDIEIYRLLKDAKRLNPETEKLIHEFTTTFKGTKNVLMTFLTKYTRPDVALDDMFFKTFNELVGVLAERIAFEEKYLYTQLHED